MSEELLREIEPGMHLCSSDYKAWGDVETVCWPEGDDAGEPVVTGTVRETRDAFYIPGSAVLEIRGGRCVRVDAVLDSMGDQGWGVAPAFLAPSAG